MKEILILLITSLCLFHADGRPGYAQEAPEDETGKLEELFEFLEEWARVDPADVKELSKEISGRSGLEAVYYVRSRVKKALKSEEDFLKEGNVVSALLQEEPENQYALYEYAYLLAMSNERQAAVEILQELKKKYPDAPYGIYLDFSLAANFMALGQYMQALPYFNKVRVNIHLLTEDDIFHVYHSLGIIYKRLKEYDRSIQYYQEAIRTDPEHPFPYQNLGLVYQELKDWDKAVEYGQKAVSLKSYAAGHDALGDAYYKKKMFMQAIEQYETALARAPEYVSAWVSLGNVHIELKDYFHAQEAYEKALQIDERSLRAMAGLGWMYNERGDYDSAIAWLQKASRINPQDGFVNKQLQSARARRAQADLSGGKLTEFENDQRASGQILIDVYPLMQAGKLKEALVEINKAIKLNQYNALAYVYAGYCYYYLEDYASAARVLKTSLDLDPYNADTARNYACTLHKLGRLDEAWEIVYQISEKVPENQAFKKLLQDIQSKNLQPAHFNQ